MTSGRPLTAVDGERVARVVPATDDAHGASVDEWGASRFGVAIGRALVARRWDVGLGGLERVPRRGGALLITNPRALALIPPMVALAVGTELDRTVRFAGVLDVAPASLLRRLGGVLARPDEVESALRGGHVVVVGATGSGLPGDLVPRRPGRSPGAGTVPPAYVDAARRARVPIHPVAVLGGPFGRRVRVEVGPAVRPRLDRRGPLAAAELADRVEGHLQRRLDEIAGGA